MVNRYRLFLEVTPRGHNRTALNGDILDVKRIIGKILWIWYGNFLIVRTTNDNGTPELDDEPPTAGRAGSDRATHPAVTSASETTEPAP